VAVGIGEARDQPTQSLVCEKPGEPRLGDLVGRGIVDPIDDFSDNNSPSHPKTLDYIADEFVANGYDLRALVRLIVNSQVYQRSHIYGAEDNKQVAEWRIVPRDAHAAICSARLCTTASSPPDISST